jgi:hypothetical protein
MHYFYLLQSEAFVDQRLWWPDIQPQATMREKSPHTSKFAPWRLVTYVAFSDERKAETFERCLKSGSGHAFAKKRLW